MSTELCVLFSLWGRCSAKQALFYMAACTLCTHTHTLIRGMVALLLLDLKICLTV